jgi:hypothetical protein
MAKFSFARFIWFIFLVLQWDVIQDKKQQTHCTVFFIASGVGLSPLYCGHFWPIVPAPDDRWGWLLGNWWNENWQGKPKYSKKTCPSATLSITNPTWPDPGSNPGRRRLTAWAMARPHCTVTQRSLSQSVYRLMHVQLPLSYYSHGRGSRIRPFEKISVTFSSKWKCKKYFPNTIFAILDTSLLLFINCRYILQR